MDKKKLARIFAASLACLSISVFAFAGCAVDEGATPPGTESNGSTGGTGDGNQSGSTGGTQGGTTGGNEGGSTGGSGSTNVPVIPTVPESAVQITKASGDLEECYAIWNKVDGAMGYNVYYKNEEGGDYVKLDAPLVREYKDYVRADAVGLKAGTYTLKVVPTGGADLQEDESKAATAENITVLAHERSGYAFMKGTSSGAYNDDGTLKSDAIVLYVTNENYSKVSVQYGGTTVTGIDNILGEGYQAKNGATKPLCVRIIGCIGDGNKVDFKANGDLELKGLTQGVTVEGIGSDATANGWGMHITSCSNVEIRNLAFMTMKGSTKDGVGFENKCDHVWTHNCDFFYGHNWGGDQKKGDGSLDSKSTDYATYSYNHFWDSGKCNLLGNSNSESSGEGGATHVTYHHNWYDHSDSRHPRIRIANTHVYNNYFDGNAKYGVGVTMGASAFVENNYFRSTANMKPMMSSKQGTDALGEGTFSGENGGMIKSFNNTYDCPSTKLKLITQNDTTDKTDIDCFEASSRNEQVPSDYKTKSGSTSYNNFDTASDFYSYEVDTPEVAKQKVEKFAGRVDGGDLKFEFDDAKEDGNYELIPELSALINGYTTQVVKIGDIATSGGSTGGETGGESGGSTLPEGTTKVEFKKGSTYPSGIKVTANYNNKTGYIKMESSTVIEITVSADTTVTIHTSAPSASIKINGTATALDGNGELKVTVKANETLKIEKKDQMDLEYVLFS